MADCSLSDWDNLSDDSKWIYEAMARLELAEFAELSISDQSAVVALALHLKRSHARTGNYQS